VLVTQLEEVWAGAVLAGERPGGLCPVERMHRGPVDQVRRSAQVKRVFLRFQLIAAQQAIVGVAFEPQIWIPDAIDTVAGLTLFRAWDDRVLGVLFPLDQLVVLGRCDTDTRTNSVVAKHGHTIFVHEGVAAVDALVRIARLRAERRGVIRPVDQVGAGNMPPAMSALSRRILEDVHQVVPALPIYAAVGVVRPGTTLVRQDADMIGGPRFGIVITGSPCVWGIPAVRWLGDHWRRLPALACLRRHGVSVFHPSLVRMGHRPR